MAFIHHQHCPVCQSNHIDPLMGVTDHSVSKEKFDIWLCRQCSLRFTQDAPDEDSIGPYYQSPDYISHTNSRKGLVNRLYQLVRRFTLKQKAALVIRHTLPEGKLLDVGAGTGAFLHVMQQQGWLVKGIEPDAGAREVANGVYGLKLDTAEALQEMGNGSFDAITLWHVLEHVHHLHETMDRLKRLLNANGRLFIAVPNYLSLDATIYKSYWAAYDVPRHLYHFSPAAMEVLLQQHGFRVLEKKPMWFDSFYISLLSSRYKWGRSRWLGAAFAGLRSNINALFRRDACSSLIYVVGKK